MTSEDRPATEFGLRFFENGNEFRLLQISGGNRVRLGEKHRKWWARLPKNVKWEVFVIGKGRKMQTYPTRELAEMVAGNLTRH